MDTMESMPMTFNVPKKLLFLDHPLLMYLLTKCDVYATRLHK